LTHEVAYGTSEKHIPKKHVEKHVKKYVRRALQSGQSAAEARGTGSRTGVRFSPVFSCCSAYSPDWLFRTNGILFTFSDF
jgi:hypothetical protein